MTVEAATKKYISVFILLCRYQYLTYQYLTNHLFRAKPKQKKLKSGKEVYRQKTPKSISTRSWVIICVARQLIWFKDTKVHLVLDGWHLKICPFHAHRKATIQLQEYFKQLLGKLLDGSRLVWNSHIQQVEAICNPPWTFISTIGYVV